MQFRLTTLALLAAVVALLPITAVASKKPAVIVSEYFRTPVYPQIRVVSSHLSKTQMEATAKVISLDAALATNNLAAVADYMSGYLSEVHSDLSSNTRLNTKEVGFTYMSNDLVLAGGNQSFSSASGSSVLCLVSLSPEHLPQFRELLNIKGVEQAGIALQGFLAHEIYHCEDSYGYRNIIASKSKELGLAKEQIASNESKEFAADLFSYIYIGSKYKTSISVIRQYKKILKALRSGLSFFGHGVYGYAERLSSAMKAVEQQSSEAMYRVATEQAILSLNKHGGER